ncbi:MAG: MerR family transcriptional regulator [Gammaproteobacteria bacterium]
MYTIKTVTALTGISTETLRAWERRYETVNPIRDQKGRRLYSKEDVERLTLLANATQQGFTIGKITGLSNVELQELLKSGDAAQLVSRELFFVQIIDALTQYRLDKCEELLKHALIALDPLSYARDILLPTLHKVGDLWHDGKLTIAQEHMFSACVKRIVLSMVNNLQPFSGPNPGILFATLSGESHEFGILLTCLLAASQHCSCYYIGPDLPWEDLIMAGVQLKPAVITISAVNTPPPSSFIESLNHLADELPDPIQLWIGGLGAQHLVDHEQLPARYLFSTSLDDFYNSVTRLITEYRS